MADRSKPTISIGGIEFPVDSIEVSIECEPVAPEFAARAANPFAIAGGMRVDWNFTIEGVTFDQDFLPWTAKPEFRSAPDAPESTTVTLDQRPEAEAARLQRLGIDPARVIDGETVQAEREDAQPTP